MWVVSEMGAHCCWGRECLLVGRGSLVGGGTAAGLCNLEKKHEKIPLNPINRENIRSGFRFLIAQKMTWRQAFW